MSRLIQNTIKSLKMLLTHSYRCLVLICYSFFHIYPSPFPLSLFPNSISPIFSLSLFPYPISLIFSLFLFPYPIFSLSLPLSPIFSLSLLLSHFPHFLSLSIIPSSPFFVLLLRCEMFFFD